MTAFVSGGSGFVGGAVIRRLVADGREVRALARSDAAASAVAALGAMPAPGDLGDPATLEAAMGGCDTVFAVAGVNRTCVRRRSELTGANVDGAAAVVRAAARAGVPRVIHTSSAATLGETEGTVGDEDASHRGAFLSEYERSKFLGERAALEAGRATGVEVVCVNPSSVQGPGRTEGTARILLRAAAADRAVLVRTWISVIDVDDCAEGHVLAERHGVAGRRYVLSGATLRLDDAVELLRAIAGGPRRVRWIPRPVVRAAMPLAALGARFSSAPDPPVCPALLRTLLHGHRYDGSRATRELGLRYRPIEETITRTVRWYREHGLLPPA
ncbi:MAG TPA: NAD-dependent epimerase/dehydratase family protein [Actinomycetota bacterium]|nr:NAD-dependent epimerase/dehydratase family protein [Actinomycetota bacterium]